MMETERVSRGRATLGGEFGYQMPHDRYSCFLPGIKRFARLSGKPFR